MKRAGTQYEQLPLIVSTPVSTVHSMPALVSLNPAMTLKFTPRYSLMALGLDRACAADRPERFGGVLQ